MSLPQRAILTATLFLIATICLFPAWIVVTQPPGGIIPATVTRQPKVPVERPAGRHLLWRAPIDPAESDIVAARIDSSRLAIELTATLLITGLLMAIFKRNP